MSATADPRSLRDCVITGKSAVTVPPHRRTPVRLANASPRLAGGPNKYRFLVGHAV